MDKMRFFLALGMIVIFASCVRNKSGQTTQTATVGSQKVFEVSEVIQANSYTYLKVKENQGERWVAVTKQDINPGDVFYYDEALQMNNFHSKDLDRTFDVVYFVNQISKDPISNQSMGVMPGMGGMMGSSHSGKVEPGKKGSIHLEKADSELTIAEVFGNRKEYAGKEIEIRGVVVKVNRQIMGKNWIHIQDGTNSDGKFDLTITSQDIAEVNDEVTFKGKITLEKDFGSGYYYDVIMEDAALVNKTTANITM
ncbi:hypothetical protein SAMN05444274_107107 [Mariniphaga anaerophila]|uniref:Uncharacterized protein n=1 Tax=Mariniphaga anaerophila TaxID=1484053 RepID=A0A1M5DI11_9BACT|nr:hypothetical protein [Mariniphaga anaerophila]SHF66545.1 hypothetical protein SAMN05444274_107107 [Mariniphaga anaerophila]